MVEIQMQPLDLSCPAKKLLSPLCLKREEHDDVSPTSSLSDIRRLSHGSDDVFVTSAERSPTRSPTNENGSYSSDSDQPQDLSRENERSESPKFSGPARKRFLSKFFKDPKGRIYPISNSNLQSSKYQLFNPYRLMKRHLSTFERVIAKQFLQPGPIASSAYNVCTLVISKVSQQAARRYHT